MVCYACQVGNTLVYADILNLLEIVVVSTAIWIGLVLLVLKDAWKGVF